MSARHQICVLAGDGIGPEVTQAAIRVLEGAAAAHGFSFEFDQPGTYHFVCSIHPSMVGTIVVQ